MCLLVKKTREINFSLVKQLPVYWSELRLAMIYVFKPMLRFNTLSPSIQNSMKEVTVDDKF